LKEADFEKDASLINRVIKDSVDSAERTKQAMRDTLVQATKETMAEAEQMIDESFKAAVGSLAEEASSELVQQELAAMGRAVTETIENVKERASMLSASLAQIAEEFAHIDIGRDTSKKELNAILARYPKTTDEVKG